MADGPGPPDDQESSTRLHHLFIGALGLVTICCYGAWYYAFGVLIDPVLEDTGWRESAVSSAFGGGLFAIGIGAVFGGRLLDRHGPRRVFLLAAVLTTVGMGAASLARSPWVFAAGTIVALGALGSLTFYHITMTTVVRLHPGRSDRAIAALTIWGAFASPIYLPMTAKLLEGFTWRSTVQILAASAVAALLMAVAVLPASPSGAPADSVPRPSLGVVMRRVAAAPDPGRPDPRRFTLAVALIGVAIAVVLTYQVPVMTAVGLPLATASTLAGLRGFAQLGGRLPLGALVSRVGAHRALLVALGAVAAGGLLLAGASTVPVAAAYALIVGFGIGAYSPLQGMYAAQLFDSQSLGATMGVYASIGQLTGAFGPAIAGMIAEQTGDRRWVVAFVVGTAAASVLALGPDRAPTSSSSGTVPRAD